MTTTLNKILEFWPQTPTTGRSPREIPNVGRDDLAQLFAHLGFTRGVEVGTERGLYAKTLCEVNPHLWLTCVDPYRAYRDYREHTSQSKLDIFYLEARSRLAGEHVDILRMESVDGSAMFYDETFDFVYIDANHNLLHVIQDLYAWVPKVRKGGLICGHDFLRRNNSLRYQCHVVEAVSAYTQCYMVDPWFILGRKETVQGETRDAVRSFMWIKE